MFIWLNGNPDAIFFILGRLFSGISRLRRNTRSTMTAVAKKTKAAVIRKTTVKVHSARVSILVSLSGYYTGRKCPHSLSNQNCLRRRSFWHVYLFRKMFIPTGKPTSTNVRSQTDFATLHQPPRVSRGCVHRGILNFVLKKHKQKANEDQYIVSQIKFCSARTRPGAFMPNGVTQFQCQEKTTPPSPPATLRIKYNIQT